MGKIRILLADDDAVVRDELSALLDMQDDFEVVGVAVDGREALERAAELKPQIVIMDVKMPVMDGLLATKELKRRYPEVRVILLSIYANDGYIQQGQAAGASTYIIKGVPLTELVETIRNVQQGKFD